VKGLPRGTLRRQLVGGALLFSVVASGAAVGQFYFIRAMRADIEDGTRVVLEEQRIAERLVIDVYRQLLDASWHLQHPEDPTGADSFRQRGEQVYQGVRQYLFRDLSVGERLQVESIKETHEVLEVEAQYAFDLAAQGRSAEAMQHRESLFALLSEMEQAVDAFVAMRLEGRARLLEDQSRALNRLFLATGALALALLAGVLGLIRLLHRRFLTPLQQLSEASTRLGRGELSVRVPVERADELAMVGQSFNEMASSLESAQVSLEERNRQLEEAYGQLQRSQDQLLTAEKMAALGKLTAGIAHEINSPLGGILNSLELARTFAQEYRASALDPEVTAQDHQAIARDLMETLQAATVATEKVAQFVRTIKGQTRTGEERSVTFDPCDEIEAALTLLQHEFRNRGVEVERDLADGLRLVGDPGKFALIVQNLISNAIDAYEEGDARIWLRLRDAGEGIVLEVEDRGCGIPEEIRHRIFDYLFTTKDVGKGTGLGLSIVHSLVTSHFSGHILLESELGRGTVFQIVFPPRIAPPGAPQLAEAQSS
jgi:signal transduction histidine kinase